MTNKQYENRIKKLMALESEKAELENQIAELKEEIIDSMKDEMVVTDNFIIRYQMIASKRFDSKSFKADHEKLYKAYQVDNNYMRFSYKTA